MVNLRSMSENQRTAGVVGLKLTHELPKLMSRSEITPKMYNNKKAKPRKKPTKKHKEGEGRYRDHPWGERDYCALWLI